VCFVILVLLFSAKLADFLVCTVRGNIKPQPNNENHRFSPHHKLLVTGAWTQVLVPFFCFGLTSIFELNSNVMIVLLVCGLQSHCSKIVGSKPTKIVGSKPISPLFCPLSPPLSKPYVRWIFPYLVIPCPVRWKLGIGSQGTQETFPCASRKS